MINVPGLLHVLIITVLDTISLSICRIKSRKDGKSRRKVLIIRPDAIGDFILWLDAARALRKLYPPQDYELTLLGNQLWSSLSEDLDAFDAVWPLERERFIWSPLYRLAMLQRVRRAQFDLVLHPVFSREFCYGDSLVRASGAQERIGFAGDNSNTSVLAKLVTDRWYTRLLTSATSEVSELQRHADFIRGLGALDYTPAIPKLDIHHNLPKGFPHNKYYILVPGAGSPGRQWPIDNFVKIAKSIYPRLGLKAVVCGVQSEAFLGEYLAVSQPDLFDDWVSRTSLQELVALIRNAEFVISNETSVIHIAAALAVPSVCILGGGHFGRFLPYEAEVKSAEQAPLCVNVVMDCFNCNWNCQFKIAKEDPYPCIERVRIDSVQSAIEQVLLKGIKTRLD